MRRAGAWSVSALCVFHIVAVSAQEHSQSIVDSVVTGREVTPFPEFEHTAQSAAATVGLAPDTVAAVLKDFKEANSVRVMLPHEWRPQLMELLYKYEIPYEVARRFLANIGGSTIENGFLSEVRFVDLSGKQVYKVGKSPAEPTAPRPVFQPLPAYTQNARMLSVQGTITLGCVILEDGNVTNCRVEKPLGYGLDESALLNIQDRWKFEPAMLNGRAVPVETKIEVTFRLY